MRKCLSLLLTLVLALSLAAPALADDGTVPAKEAAMYFRVDGKLCPHISAEDIHGNGLAYNVCMSYIIDNEHYVQLREVAVYMGFSRTPFDVRYDEATNSVEIVPGADYTGETKIPPIYGQFVDGNTVTARPSVNPMSVNGAPRQVTAYVIDGHNYMRLRDIGDLAGFDVSWDQELQQVGLWSGSGATGSAGAAWSVARATVDGQPEDDRLKMPSCLVNTTPSYLYAPNAWGIYDSGDGTVTVVDASSNQNFYEDAWAYSPVEVSVYDKDFHRLSTTTLPQELPLFGGFLHGEKYNYIAYGQENPDEDDGLETVRIVKYDHDWNRLGAASMRNDRLDNAMTTPFATAGAVMAEDGDLLVLHMGFLGYAISDGTIHQGSSTYGFDMSQYKQLNENRFRGGSSHSFGLDLLIDSDGAIVTVDASDTYPRGLVLQRLHEYASTFPQAGRNGSNIGITLGSLAETENAYVVAGANLDPAVWLDQGNYVDSHAEIVVAAVPKSSVSTDSAKEYTVGDYLGTDKLGFMPWAVSLPGGRAVVLWQEYESLGDTYAFSNKPLDLKAQVLDQNGKPTGEVLSFPGLATSTCRPTLVGDSLMWFGNQGGTRYLYTLPLSELG